MGLVEVDGGFGGGGDKIMTIHYMYVHQGVNFLYSVDHLVKCCFYKHALHLNCSLLPLSIAL